jgi:threonine/homoserine/homoserine lactone efflux protein
MLTMDLLPLLLFLLPLAYSPGPGNSFFALSGAQHGLVRTMPALLGYHVATLFVTWSIGSGLSFTLLTSPVMAAILSALSAGYMFWLAWTCVRAVPSLGHEKLQNDQVIHPPSFWSGAIVLLLNPKAYSIIFLMFATFLQAGAAHLGVMLITIVFTLNNFLAFVLWALAGQLLSRYLGGSFANVVYGLAFVVVGIWIASGLIWT